MKWNEVTWYSKLGAIILFIGVVPVLTFYIGMQYGSYQEQMDNIKVVVIDTPKTDTSSPEEDLDIITPDKPSPQEEEQVFCTMDAKMCPDGSYVGRTGPSCAFAACPTDNSNGVISMGLGESKTALTVTVSPEAIVSDNRCPADVTCIWAGTVEVKTVLATPVSHGEHTLKLGEPQIFGDYTVTLTDVAPIKTQESIPDSNYNFTYEVKKTY